METLANNKNKTINAENATFFAQFQKCNDNCTTIKSMKYQKLINHIVYLKTFNVVYVVYVQYCLDNKKFASKKYTNKYIYIWIYGSETALFQRLS